MYIEKYPKAKVLSDFFRRIFHNSFNIGFGYPRKDTCSQCDSNHVDTAYCRKTFLKKFWNWEGNIKYRKDAKSAARIK